MATLDQVRELALAMPGAFEKASYGGRPSWRTKSKMFCWYREDPDALVAWVESEEEKQVLLDGEPEKFCTTDHYDGHPIVLVRIENVAVDELEEIIIESWRMRATKTALKQWDADHPPD